MYIATQLLIASLNTTPAMTGVPDLCDLVDPNTGTPTICKPHKEGAPIYNANVCCTGSTCVPTVRGSCQSGQSLYYCGLGEQTPTGAFACYFEVPHYCEVHSCTTSLTPPPLELPLCCNAGICWALDINANDCELDDIYWCSEGESNADGTVTCLEGG